MGALLSKNSKPKATNSDNSGKSRVKGKFVIIPADKVEADRCRAYAYTF